MLLTNNKQLSSGKHGKICIKTSLSKQDFVSKMRRMYDCCAGRTIKEIVDVVLDNGVSMS
jgi:hypothetical protein